MIRQRGFIPSLESRIYGANILDKDLLWGLGMESGCSLAAFRYVPTSRYAHYLSVGGLSTVSLRNFGAFGAIGRRGEGVLAKGRRRGRRRRDYLRTFECEFRTAW